jgi:glycosyltransferase A (GT-A) superfamily protein (DUF2064 family)/SAM-dependent methyltransferase
VSTLIVIAKSPVPGRVKTRLCPPFTPQQAASLAEAALADTLDAVARSPADHRLLYLDGEPGPWLPIGIKVLPQVTGPLDVRLAAAFAEAARIDPGPALLVGMDTPQITPRVLVEALAELGAHADEPPFGAVFGPAEDGGFWALGLRQPGHPRVDGLLLGVPMSRADTGEIQHRRLVDAGLSIRLLARELDVDTAQDAYAVAARIPGSRFARRLARIEQLSAATSPAPRPAGQDWGGPVSAGYEQALWQSLSRESGPLLLRGEPGVVIRLDVARYAAAPDAADAVLLDRCTGPTLDIGCGPGRLAAGLAHRGVPSLGVDVTPVALLLARAAGATALRRSVFDRLPGEGRWPHALLIDGNIGIGGDPRALLDRIKTLLKPSGAELLVETAPQDIDERHHLRVGEHGATVPWALVGVTALCALAEPLGYSLAANWGTAGRHFTALAT